MSLHTVFHSLRNYTARIGGHYNLVLVCGQIAVLSLILILLLVHATNLDSYLGAAGVLAAISGVSLLGKMQMKYVFIQGLVLFLAVRLMYFFSTDFKTIPFGDAYWDLAVVKAFLLDNGVSIIDHPLYPARLMTWYSSWPLLHSFEATFIQMSGVAVEAFHMLIALFISGLTFVFGFLFIRQIGTILKVESNFIYVALAFLAISPEAIFWGLSPTRQEIGMMLLTLSFFLVAKMIRQRSRGFLAIILMCLVALALAHHFTAAVAIGAFGGLAITFPPRRLRWTYITFASILTITVVLWWIGYANVVFESPSVDFLSSDFLSFNLANLRPASYPDQLSPVWAITLLKIRDVILYATPILGALMAIRYRTNPAVRYLLVVAAAGALILVLNLSIAGLEPTRVLMLFMPFYVLLAGFGLSKVASYVNINRKFVSAGFAATLIVVLFASLVGLWGHDYAPLHLFDSSINSAAVGENGPHSTEVKKFLVNNVDYSHIDKIVSEFQNSPVLVLPESQYSKIRIMDNTVPVNDGRSMVISTDDLYVYKYYKGYFAGLDPAQTDRLRHSLEKILASFDLVYSDGTNRVWK